MVYASYKICSACISDRSRLDVRKVEGKHKIGVGLIQGRRRVAAGWIYVPEGL